MVVVWYCVLIWNSVSFSDMTTLPKVFHTEKGCWDAVEQAHKQKPYVEGMCISVGMDD